MSDPRRRFNPRLLQARWELGGVDPEELVSQAVIALEQGSGGNALQQLAGLVRPTRRDLEDLPERTFAEMGLEPIDKEQAVAYLLAQGEPPTSSTVNELRHAFPAFSERWKRHVANWGGNPAGSYNDMAEFVLFIVEDLYEKGNLNGARRAFELLDQLFLEGDQQARDLIAYGFFESLQNIASWRAYGKAVFEQFMAPTSLQVWREIERQWAGKSSLMDVIRSERQQS